MSRFHRLFVFCVFCLCQVASSFAVEVVVDPGSFSGQWSVSNVPEAGFSVGTRTLSLDPGPYTFFAASIGYFFVDVAVDGTVSARNGVSATGGIGQLTFNTVPVSIDPGLFLGQHGISRVLTFQAGPRTVDLVLGTQYIAITGSEGSFIFKVALDGTITINNNTSAIGGLESLTFNTVDVLIDPAGFEGQWRLLFVNDWLTGPETLTLVPGVRQVSSIAGIGRFNWRIAGDGTVTVDNEVSGFGGFESLVFNALPIQLDANGYPGYWWISRFPESVLGSTVVHLVPGTRYLIFVAAGNTGIGGNFSFDVEADGTVTSTNDGISLISDVPGVMQFNTLPVSLTTDYTGTWRILGIGDPEVLETVGDGTVNLVAGLRYYLHPGYNTPQPFVVTDLNPDPAQVECAVTPSSLAFGASSFQIGCGEPDDDDDGIPNTSDNCPLQANAEQVDFDQDGIGDVCDDDLDGDGFANVVDNCPDAVNPDQTDFDGDGVGDACDSDSDGDSVPNSVDNCSSTPNTDQADSDGDTLGDACDPDDDGDGLDDLVDNCPQAANPDQADFDGDGDGDVCDGDTDSDGIPNESDLCELSPAGELADGGGCTGAQRIARNCVREDFVQHGQYVSCVAHEANDAVDLGLITPQQKAQFIRAAAKAD